MLLIGFMGISQVPILPSQPIQRTTVVYPYQVIIQTDNFLTVTEGPANVNFLQNAWTIDSNILLETQKVLDGTIVNLPRRTSNLFPEPSGVYVVPEYRGLFNTNNK